MTEPDAGGSVDDPTWQRLNDQLHWYKRNSARCQRLFKRLKLAEIVIAAVVPVAAAAGAPKLLTSLLAAFVVVTEGAQQTYQWQTNWLLYRGTAEALKTEKHLFLAAAGPYTGPGRNTLLAERVEGILGQERGQWSEMHRGRDRRPPSTH